MWGAEVLELPHGVSLHLLVLFLRIFLSDGDTKHRLDLLQSFNQSENHDGDNCIFISNEPVDINDSQKVFFLLEKNIPPFETSI